MQIIKEFRAPTFAERFAEGIGRGGKSLAEGYVKKLQGDQEQKQLMQSFSNVQGMLDNPDLSDEQRTVGIYKEFHKNPKLAESMLGSVEKQKKSRGENVAGQQFSKGYDAIISGDSEGLQQVLADPTTPLNVKSKLTELQDRQETRKNVQSRELRGRQTLVQKSYKQAIESERKKISKDVYPRQPQKEIDAINKKIKKLEALQKHDLKTLSKNPDSYTNLHLWNFVDADFLPEEEEEFDGEESFGQQGKQAQEKVKFSRSNPEHVKKAKQAIQQAGGDRDKANRILAEEFSK